MAATQTVHQLANPDNSAARTTRFISPQHGVVTLFGYGISVHVDRGHLIFRDGIGATRREARFPRVGHGVRRLVVIGSDGMVSLAALRCAGWQTKTLHLSCLIGMALCSRLLVQSDRRMRGFDALKLSQVRMGWL